MGAFPCERVPGGAEPEIRLPILQRMHMVHQRARTIARWTGIQLAAALFHTIFADINIATLYRGVNAQLAVWPGRALAYDLRVSSRLVIKFKKYPT